MDDKIIQLLAIPKNQYYIEYIINETIRETTNYDGMKLFLHDTFPQFFREIEELMGKRVPFLIIPSENYMKEVGIDRHKLLDEIKKKAFDFEKIQITTKKDKVDPSSFFDKVQNSLWRIFDKKD